MNHLFYRILAATLLLGSGTSQATIPLSDSPLFLTVAVAPNLIMTMDDSRSMGWGYVPDSLRSTQAKLDGPRFTAASYNPLYYNPKVNYTIPTRIDGISYSTSYTQAHVNGFDTGKGYADLSNTTTLSAPNQKGYKPIAEYFNNNQSDCTTHADTTQNTTLCRVAYNQGPNTSYSYSCTVAFDRRSGSDRIDVSGCSPAGSLFTSGNNMTVGTTLTISGAGSGYNGDYTVNNVASASRLEFSNADFPSDSTKTGVTVAWTYQNTITTAYYTLYYTDKSGAAKPTGCDDSKETDACYLLISVGSSDDLAVRGGTLAQSQQNFANWYSFYRTRALAAISSAIKAVSSFKTNEVRFGWQAVNADTACPDFGTTCNDYSGASHENRIRKLDGPKTGDATTTHRSDFYNWVQKLDITGGTPLRSALQRVGEYFKTSGQDSPYAEDPYVSQGTELACRKNFHILFTDGLWNDDSGYSIGNLDNPSSALTLPDAQTYSGLAPYKDGESHTLADTAFKYWSTDLRSTLDDKVAPFIVDRSGTTTQQYWNAKNNPASWQHLVNFTIGLGLGSFLTDPAWGGSTYLGDYSALVAGTKNWPSTGTQSNRVYDLWHAAINSRGQFFSADTPDALSTAFQSVMNSILNANPSAAALAANSTSIQTGTLVYQARFDSTDWHGQLLAFPVQGSGSVGTAQWDSAALSPLLASSSATVPSRNIFTTDNSSGTGSGKAFSSCNSSMSAAQKTALDTAADGVTVDNRCAERMAWLRGDNSKEVRFSGGIFRNRTVSLLGDIVNSDPAYVKNEDYGYGKSSSALNSSEKGSYTAFVAGKASRTPMVYVGANDGMLHAIRADLGNTNSGRELFAYIPAGVYGNLSKLTATNYSHKPFVDGPPATGDAYLSGGWKTVLVGGLGGGGKSVYALNISTPDSFAASDVMWEFTDSADLGYTYSQPQIARLHDGNWAAIFGNGYNSSNDRAYLYVVNLSSGAVIRKIALGTSTGNGLSTPYLHDANSDGITDYVYAGDLQGNLWKVDLSAASSASWAVSNSGNPLFTARNASNQVQAITSQPKVGAHPLGGALVYFGTGRYLGTTDTSNLEVQSFYAIRDNGSTVLRSQLQQQTIINQTTEYGYETRASSNNSVDWNSQNGWYMDLVPPSPGSAQGERVVSTPLLKYDRVIFVTLIPSTDPCVPGGSSWIMEMDLVTGSRPNTSPFDFNNDNKFDSGDNLASGNPATGVKSTEGITKTPVWLESGQNDGVAYKELSGTSGNIMTLRNKGKPPSTTLPVRIFWQQIL